MVHLWLASRPQVKRVPVIEWETRPAPIISREDEMPDIDEEAKMSESGEIMDLLYDGAAEADVTSRFPSAVISDASDIVHESRIEVRVKATREEWYKFLIESGWGAVSLDLQLAISTPGEGRDLVRRLMEAR